MLQPLKIGTLTLATPLFLAPMAGITNLPMRLLAREYGASLCFTEMVSVNGLVREGEKSFDLVKSSPDDRPLGVQIFGDDPETLAQGARLIEVYGDLIDINMGCPVRKVVGTGAGSALLREPARVAAIVRAVRTATRLPLTIKIRSGWHAGDNNFLEIGRIAEAEGCDAVTLHPRSRAQMFDGHADWSQLAELKRAVGIPVIGSGDLFRAEDATAMMTQTGCDGVMIARGGLGNPWMFREIVSCLAGGAPSPPMAEERLRTAVKHLELFIALSGEAAAVREMRKHLAWYAKGLPGAARFRAGVNLLTTTADMVRAIEEFFSEEEIRA
jgi:tRNA-dihydrouridine synthase B